MQNDTIQIPQPEKARTLVLPTRGRPEYGPKLIEHENEAESREDYSTCLDSNSSDRLHEKASDVTESPKLNAVSD